MSRRGPGLHDVAREAFREAVALRPEDHGFPPRPRARSFCPRCGHETTAKAVCPQCGAPNTSGH